MNTIKTFNEIDWTIYPYYELCNIENIALRAKYLMAYQEEYAKICELYPNAELPFGKSISEYYYLLEEQVKTNESTYIFPGNIVCFYPALNIKVAKKDCTCFISGAVIKQGSEYLSYKAFLYNKTLKKSFVTQEIKAELGIDYSFPLTLEDFELFYYRLSNSYTLNLIAEYNIESMLKSPYIRCLRKHK